jgi:co-chaperonin GroES (HSP10)
MIRALHNHIIFEFEDPVTAKGEFEETQHKSGIYLKGGFEKSAKSPRWATILNVGPDCDHVCVGDRILIPALRWTEGIKFQDRRYWKTDESQIVGYVHNDEFVLINEYVTFTKFEEVISKHSSGLVVISHIPTDTPHGAVSAIATGCVAELLNSTIYYDGANFFNTFEYDHSELSFIKESDILAYAPGEV